MITADDLKPFGGGASTERLQSLAEKISWKVRARCEAVRCSLYIYDEAGDETLIYKEEAFADSDGFVKFSYSFDPVSLAVYRNAAQFRAAVCPVAAGEEFVLEEFTLSEEKAERREDSSERLCNIAVDAEGNRAVSVMQTDGREITVPLVPKKVLFVGNSILLGMHNAYGMCASGPRKDYFYYVSEAIKKKNPDCEFLKLHGAGFEHSESEEMFERWYSEEPNAYTGQPPAENSFTGDLDLIIIQLTDNVNTPEKLAVFPHNLETLLMRVKACCPRARILWVHGWYQRDNAVIYESLLKASRRWKIERIDISDLKCRENEGIPGQTYLDADGKQSPVKDLWLSHPGDNGMKKIAGRIIDVLGI